MIDKRSLQSWDFILPAGSRRTILPRRLGQNHHFVRFFSLLVFWPCYSSFHSFGIVIKNWDLVRPPPWLEQDTRFGHSCFVLKALLIWCCMKPGWKYMCWCCRTVWIVWWWRPAPRCKSTSPTASSPPPVSSLSSFSPPKMLSRILLLIPIVVLFQQPTNLLTLGVLSQNLTWDNLATLFVLTQLLHQPEVESTTIVIIETGIAKFQW